MSYAPKTIRLDMPLDEFPIKRLAPWAKRFYFIYKSTHVVDQYFDRRVQRLSNEPYDDIDELYCQLKSIFGHAAVTKQWLMAKWDYFNPNIQRKIKVSWREQVRHNQKLVMRYKKI